MLSTKSATVQILVESLQKKRALNTENIGSFGICLTENECSIIAVLSELSVLSETKKLKSGDDRIKTGNEVSRYSKRLTKKVSKNSFTTPTPDQNAAETLINLSSKIS